MMGRQAQPRSPAATLTQIAQRAGCAVSVIGFDDITANVALPPLTVVSLQLREVGLAAAALALELAADPGARQRLEGRVLPVPTQFVVRRSTGPAARKRTRRRKAVS